MPELEFHIDGWPGASTGEPLERETFAHLRITAGSNHVPLTEVDDSFGSTVRPYINVPAYLMARWLLVNWWRLRWEPFHGKRSHDWLSSHSMAAIGGGYAWPALTFSCDGELTQLRLESETAPDASAIRYLRDATIDVPASDFERAVERFLDIIEARLAIRAPQERELSELREELKQERNNPDLSEVCKLQALAGLDPGSASDEWISKANALRERAGLTAGDEVLAVLPALDGGLDAADAAISAMRDSKVTVKLDWSGCPATPPLSSEIPWVRGARLAREFRTSQQMSSGPVTQEALQDLLAVNLPLPVSAWPGPKQLLGGYRNGTTQGRTALLVTKRRDESQRFYLARLIGAALVSNADQHLLPVSDAGTALQKFERSFAQEFLCPWQELDAFTDQSGTGDEGIAEAAEHFMVSERLILSTLVNKGKVSRGRLATYGGA